jgi:hypothetical protein
MGHSSIRVTLDLYGHLFPDANRGVLDILDELTAPSRPHRANELKTGPEGEVPVTRDFEDGSDGTRTRDLRRDRPSRAQRRPATNASEQPHLQALFAPTPPLLRMVEPIVQ